MKFLVKFYIYSMILLYNGDKSWKFILSYYVLLMLRTSYDYAGTDDDAALVKRMGQSFRFSAIEVCRVISFHYLSLSTDFLQSDLKIKYLVLIINSQARREEQLKAAHDEAMFGAPTLQTPTDNTDNDVSEKTNVKDDEEENKSGTTISLLSDKVKNSELSFISFALEPIDPWSSILRSILKLV